MKNLFIVGYVTGGQGGMETVFKNFNNLFQAFYNIHFFGLQKDDDISGCNFEWTNNLNFTLIKPKDYKIRQLKKYSLSVQLKKKLNELKPLSILAYDDFGCRIAFDALKKSSHTCPLVSWLHFNFNVFPDKAKKYISKMDYHLAICDEIKSQMIADGIDETKIDVIYNPVSIKLESIKRSINHDGTINFIYVGRVQYSGQKNLQEMFYALSNINFAFKLNIIGDSFNEYDRLMLKGLSVELNIADKIVWHGWQDNPWNYIINNIKVVDSLLLSSSHEGFPLTLLEAMSYGVFCISSNCETGPKEIINNNNGFIYKLHDIDDFVDKLERVKIADLPCQENIKKSINHFYNEMYVMRINNLLLNKFNVISDN